MRRLLPLLLLAAMPAFAQQPDRPANLQPLPAVLPPPGIDSWDATLEPQVTIKKNDRETREEYRMNGRLYMIKVTPAVGPSYYLVDQQGDGSFARSESAGPVTRPPMWVIKEF